ncbi:LysR family transcriptional regulator [Hoeflea poritis]|uniref:LysR substrate-binding domain-containing protein n=1 Tax=Hoeflea poritis TaxID=2993659 RepID=A0ABT4VP50_9HYPH|nr:LysR substrate-binding domain-containing protein [Hoeflea poritis]MDA4846399.1 LysR substrate-binding domain-containing protein [Hoeflea poritis]
MQALDTDLLRTFLAIADAGSFVGGAARIYRSQSAASIQIRKLEDLIGAPVFERHGRGIRLTPVGETLEPAARQAVRLLDGTLAQLRDDGLKGSLRIGIPDDHSRDVLSRIIADFSQRHPNVELSVHCALSAGFSKSLATGALDIAVHEVATVLPEMTLLREEKLQWAASSALQPDPGDPLPIALYDRDCWWRDAALRSLEIAGRAYRIVYSSESTTGIVAALEAGIAAGVVGASAMGARLEPVTGLGVIPPSNLVIEYGRVADMDICRAMTAVIQNAFAA